MEYLREIIWYLSLLMIAYITVGFVRWNLKAFDTIASREHSEAFKK